MEKAKVLLPFFRNEKPRHIESNIPSVHFCQEMYNFSFYIAEYDLISYYQDECIYDVSMETRSSSTCKYIKDKTIRNICYESIT